MTEEGVAVGIDLGTTFSCVSVFRNGRVKVIPDDDGNHVIPSCVGFTDKSFIVGREAKSTLPKERYTPVYEVKRLMGRPYDDPLVQEDKQRWTFDVVDDNGKPKVKTLQNNKVILHSPEQISSIILRKLVEIAAEYLKDCGETKPITQAVVTVPAYFNDSQRQATKTAAELAGLKVLRIINEPTAAAIAYGFKTKIEEEERILVFDLGGGTFDVSIIQIEDSIIQVLATGGDTHLGGADFDNRIARKIMTYFNQKMDAKEPESLLEKKRMWQRLVRLVESAKCELSGSSDNKFAMTIDAFCDDKDLEYDLYKSTFDEVNQDLFTKTIDHVRSVVKDAGLALDEIDHVVLVGGSTRIPKVQEMLREFFQGKRLNRTINPDEAVAHGAAITAGILTRQPGVDDVLLMDVTPLTLGIVVKGGLMLNVIHRNTLIPALGQKSVTTTEDDLDELTISVYQGERTLTKDNHFLGRFTLSGIEKAAAGVPDINILFDIDSNGILQVTAKDLKTGVKSAVEITPNKARMSEKDVLRVKGEAQFHMKEDIQEKNRIVARNELEAFIKWMRYLLRETRYNVCIHRNIREAVTTKCAEVSTWITENEEASEDEYKYQYEITKEVCSELPPDYLIPGRLPDPPRTKPRRTRPPEETIFSDDDEKFGDFD